MPQYPNVKLLPNIYMDIIIWEKVKTGLFEAVVIFSNNKANNIS